jgi:hypothetical protein
MLLSFSFSNHIEWLWVAQHSIHKNILYSQHVNWTIHPCDDHCSEIGIAWSKQPKLVILKNILLLENQFQS